MVDFGHSQSGLHFPQPNIDEPEVGSDVGALVPALLDLDNWTEWRLASKISYTAHDIRGTLEVTYRGPVSAAVLTWVDHPVEDILMGERCVTSRTFSAHDFV